MQTWWLCVHKITPSLLHNVFTHSLFSSHLLCSPTVVFTLSYFNYLSRPHYLYFTAYLHVRPWPLTSGYNTRHTLTPKAFTTGLSLHTPSLSSLPILLSLSIKNACMRCVCLVVLLLLPQQLKRKTRTQQRESRVGTKVDWSRI